MRVKITFPYTLLAWLLAMGAAYVVSQIVLDTIEERFTNLLIEAGKLASDWMVQEEDRLLTRWDTFSGSVLSSGRSQA